MLIAVGLLPLAYLFSSFPIARFEQETITINVHPDHITVDGVYFYRNPYPFPIVQGLSIPLPADASHPAPVTMQVEELSPRPMVLGLRNLWGAPRFDLSLQRNEIVCLRVRYYQQAPASNARYILTTTKPWLRPLLSGEYRLIPHGVILLQSNYPVVKGVEGSSWVFG